MYKLNVLIVNPNTELGTEGYNCNGYYQLFTYNKNYIDNLITLLKLKFLRDLAPCDGSFLCYCNIKNNIKCKYCYDESGSLRQDFMGSLGDSFDISKKNEYLFQIDIYDYRQTGSEEQIRLSDFDVNLFDKYLDSYNKKCIDYIPIFDSSYEDIKDIPKCYEKFLDYVMYNGVYIKYDVFMKMLENTKFSIYSIVYDHYQCIIDNFHIDDFEEFCYRKYT